LSSLVSDIIQPKRAEQLDRIALAATLLTPVFSVHGRIFAEMAIILTATLFLLRSASLRDWSWLRAGWVPIGLAWWGWLVVCSLPLPGLGLGGAGSAVQAVLTVRYLLFVAALEHVVLRKPTRRRWLYYVIAAAAAYIAMQSMLQFLTGYNLFGDPRGIDGELTGPYDKPRAGAQMSILLFPAVLPVVSRLLAQPQLLPRLGATALALGGVGVQVLIGQRMPLLLTGLGLVVSGILLPKLRGVVLGAVLAATFLVGASAVISPPTFYRLVTKFADQMGHFSTSPYGLIAVRAVVIAEQHPWTGRGFDGFRTGCPEPRYFHGWTWPTSPADNGGGADLCMQHPHNFYLQAVTDAGVPGLLLFSALVLSWFIILGRRLWHSSDPVAVGLFAAVLMHLWPVASASAVTAMPISGFFFVLLGWALAERRWSCEVRNQRKMTEVQRNRLD